MESQPQNPEFRINPKNFHPCDHIQSQCFLLKFCYRSNHIFFLSKINNVHNLLIIGIYQLALKFSKS